MMHDHDYLAFPGHRGIDTSVAAAASIAPSLGCLQAKVYMDEGIALLTLVRKAHSLFDSESGINKRRLLNFVLSNCTWKDGELRADYRQPFDMLTEQLTCPRQSLDHNESLAVKYDGPCACTSASGVMLSSCSNARRACAGVRFGLVTVLRRSPISLCHLGFERERADAAQI